MNGSSFAARLALALSGKTVHAFARESGIPDSTLRKYLNGSVPGLDNLLVISNVAGVTLDWLIAGKGPMRREESPVREGAEFAFVPRLDVQASAGPGSAVEAEEPVGVVAFRTEWLHRRGINAAAAHVLTAKGDSMEPTIRDGDILLVDTSIDRVLDNAIYVVVYSGRTLVKRVQLRLDGSLLLRSDNKDVFDDEAVAAADVPSVNIAGRVMWFGRSI